jgi:hypothetical protein
MGQGRPVANFPGLAYADQGSIAGLEAVGRSQKSVVRELRASIGNIDHKS